MVSSRHFSHALRGFVVLAVSVSPGVVSSRLFSHALRGLVVLAVSVTPGVVSSRLFSHTLCGLVVLVVSVTPGVVSSRLFSHALRGLVVLAVSVTPSMVSSRLFSHALRGLVVLGRDGRSAGHGDREVGRWREIIFDFDLSRFNTTGFVRSSSPYHPRGVSIFPDRRRSIHTKERNKQDRNQGSQCMTQNRKNQETL